MNEYQKTFDQFCKIFCYAYIVWLFLDLLPHLPNEIAGRIVNALLSKAGI